jgi:hypothetical protein
MCYYNKKMIAFFFFLSISKLLLLSKMLNNKLLILPEVEDIDLFLQPAKERSKNDEYNKIRENVLLHILELDDEYLCDPEYGEKWRNIKNKFQNILVSLGPDSFDSIKIVKMGGMRYNHDYLVDFLDSSKTSLNQIKLEFKHNNTSANKLPQFLELYDKDCKKFYQMFSYSYTEFYYDHFLDRYLTLLDTPLEKPEKETYLKHVYDIKYKHSFFHTLYQNKDIRLKEKRQLAQESISQYLTKYIDTFDFKKIQEKIATSQKNKVFLFWDFHKFHSETVQVQDIAITNVIPGSIKHLYFDLKVARFAYNIRVRLNWGNSAGLANPRWKFTFLPKANSNTTDK